MDFAIGELARRAGYAVQTIRYYEQIGLMPAPARSSGGQRRYGPDLVRRLIFIRRARDLGFSVDDVRSLLALSSDPDQSCKNVDEIATAHLAAIDAKIATLRSLRRHVNDMIECCAKTRIADCRIIDRLAGEPDARKYCGQIGHRRATAKAAR
jgi:DNA-binding transcriptional MerR regulator